MGPLALGASCSDHAVQGPFGEPQVQHIARRHLLVAVDDVPGRRPGQGIAPFQGLKGVEGAKAQRQGLQAMAGRIQKAPACCNQYLAYVSEVTPLLL